MAVGVTTVITRKQAFRPFYLLLPVLLAQAAYILSTLETAPTTPFEDGAHVRAAVRCRMHACLAAVIVAARYRPLHCEAPPGDTIAGVGKLSPWVV